MSTYIKRGIASIPSVTYDPDRVDYKSKTTAKEIQKEFSFKMKEKEKEKEE